MDYKIWAKALANRLEETTDLIGKQQTGFIKKRNIFTNIRTTAEIVSYLHDNRKEGVIITIDFEKCFDRVEYKSIAGAFHYFGFGEEFIKMLFLLFSDLELCTYSNGYVSKHMCKGRGANQGCPASPLVYNYCGEVMSQLLYNNPNITGLGCAWGYSFAVAICR